MWSFTCATDGATYSPIRTEADYQAALKLVAPYLENGPEIKSDMVALIEACEAAHYLNNWWLHARLRRRLSANVIGRRSAQPWLP